jgi:hypothetical protein
MQTAPKMENCNSEEHNEKLQHKALQLEDGTATPKNCNSDEARSSINCNSEMSQNYGSKSCNSKTCAAPIGAAPEMGHNRGTIRNCNSKGSSKSTPEEPGSGKFRAGVPTQNSTSGTATETAAQTAD